MMVFQLLIALVYFNTGYSAASGQQVPAEDSIMYHDGFDFDVIGKYHAEKHWGRFPERFKSTLRENVWNLGKNTAGIGIRFSTNATTILVRWEVMNETNLRHMPATGVRGVDLYALADGKWQYVRTGFPTGKISEATVLSDGSGQATEYLLNLPLYDGVVSLEIGVNDGAAITPAKDRSLLSAKPVVYYGTSISQGGCASRPGLAFTNILSRKLGREIVNFGFSGNGTIETSVGEAMVEADAALYVIDCNANTSEELIYDRTVELVRLLKEKRPTVPILLVEGFANESFRLTPASGVNQNVVKKQKALRRAFEKLKQSGVKDIHYKTGDGLIGEDHEGTVDGIHPNDIGMLRIAEALYPVLRKIL
jgi:lysophospholipase L1-like esterase